MQDNIPVSGVRRKRPPRTLDLSDPEAVAGFLARIGYDQANIARALVARCDVDQLTAQRIVSDACAQLTTTGGRT